MTIHAIRGRFALAGILTLLGAGLAFGSADEADEDQADVRVMSFNIRYGSASDGENRWDLRREFVVETIRAFDPDLLGTQETLGFQRDYLAENLPGYRVLGVGRTDGAEEGEMMAIYVKDDRFEWLESGHFWLSDSPETIGSESWDTSLPRMVTWARLRDRRDPDALPILFLNTHFDHRGRVARLESAKLIRERIGSLGEGCSIVLTGDFNTAEGSEPHQALFGEDLDGHASPVIDSYRSAHPEPGDSEGTFSNFSAASTSGARIDWIGVSRDWEIHDASIDRTERDGRTPSDHYPVTAVLHR